MRWKNNNNYVVVSPKVQAPNFLISTEEQQKCVQRDHQWLHFGINSFTAIKEDQLESSTENESEKLFVLFFYGELPIIIYEEVKEISRCGWSNAVNRTVK